MKALSQYLHTYAESEVACSEHITGNYTHAVIIPAYSEGASLLALLDQIARFDHEKIIVIVIVNAHEKASAAEFAQNDDVWQQMVVRYTQQIGIQSETIKIRQLGQHDLLLINRSLKTNMLSSKEGVGKARKIAADIAFALYLQQKLTSPWIHTTDADVMLPNDYFDRVATSKYTDCAALIFPFQHHKLGDTQQQRAMQYYEFILQYYVDGLRYANSPYAFHTIGSTMVFHAEYYAKVRGFPKRAAGEDFYFLNKLAKVGKITQLTGAPLRIQGRLSDRVPFGTGFALHKILKQWQQGEHYCYYHPQIFTLLKQTLQAMRALTPSCDAAAAKTQLRAHLLDPMDFSQVEQALNAQQFFTIITKLSQQCRDQAQLQQQLMAWFDAFRTLKFIHYLRDQYLPSQTVDSLMAMRAFACEAELVSHNM